jgi:two-component system, NtrC family, response regulator AlgB
LRANPPGTAPVRRSDAKRLQSTAGRPASGASSLMNILVIDDELSIRRTTAIALGQLGHEVAQASSSAAALRELHGEHFDVAFLDLRLGQEDGLEVMARLLEVNPALRVIVFTAYATLETAVEAIKAGAYDYIAKPFLPEQVKQVLLKIEQKEKLERRVNELQSQISSESPEIEMSFRDPLMQHVLELGTRAAASTATILLLGPSGTGKSVLARCLHERSPRREQGFVTVACPSLSRELLESELFGHRKGSFTGATADAWGKVAGADGGTLFLDEIGEMPLEIQPKLLRLLQEKEYERVGETKTRKADIRLIAATNRDLAKAVEEGNFREDLYYRLNVIALELPPLRDRPSDILPMAENFLRFIAKQIGKKVTGFSPEARKLIHSHEWPGNLRELRNCIERAVILTNHEVIEPGDLPTLSATRTSPAVTTGALVSLDELEMEHIRRVMARSSSLEEAAQVLGIDTATLYRKRKKMNLV